MNIVKKVSQQYSRLPWVVGFSGGKDSTIAVHVIVEAIKRGVKFSKVYVVYEDTLLEYPSLRLSALETLNSLHKVSQEELGSIVEPIVLKPKPGEDFISMMILRGYTAPGPRFRWCTRVLKLNPLKNFVHSLGEFIMVSGVRFYESNYRKKNLENKEFLKNAVTQINFAGFKTTTVMPIFTWQNEKC